MTWDDNVFRFPEQDRSEITVDQARSILLMSRVSVDRILGAYGQEDELRAWAENQGFTVAGHVLESRSGRLPLEERLDMLSVLEWLAQQDVDAIAWATFSRVARNTEQTDRIFHACWDMDVRTYVLRGKDEREPYGEVHPNHPKGFWWPYALQAEDEGRVFQERMTAGKRQKVLRGAWPVSGCAPPPFEMDRTQRPDPFTGEPITVQIPNRERWELKERMIAMRESGMSFRELAEALNAEGTLQRHGAPWYWETVRSVVRKPFPILHDVVADNPYERPDTEGLPAPRFTDRVRRLA